jgi:hypothetical protein
LDAARDAHVALIQTGAYAAALQLRRPANAADGAFAAVWLWTFRPAETDDVADGLSSDPAAMLRDRGLTVDCEGIWTLRPSLAGFGSGVPGGSSGASVTNPAPPFSPRVVLRAVEAACVAGLASGGGYVPLGALLVAAPARGMPLPEHVLSAGGGTRAVAVRCRFDAAGYVRVHIAPAVAALQRPGAAAMTRLLGGDRCRVVVAPAGWSGIALGVEAASDAHRAAVAGLLAGGLLDDESLALLRDELSAAEWVRGVTDTAPRLVARVLLECGAVVPVPYEMLYMPGLRRPPLRVLDPLSSSFHWRSLGDGGAGNFVAEDGSLRFVHAGDGSSCAAQGESSFVPPSSEPLLESYLQALQSRLVATQVSRGAGLGGSLPSSPSQVGRSPLSPQQYMRLGRSPMTGTPAPLTPALTPATPALLVSTPGDGRMDVENDEEYGGQLESDAPEGLDPAPEEDAIMALERPVDAAPEPTEKPQPVPVPMPIVEVSQPSPLPMTAFPAALSPVAAAAMTHDDTDEPMDFSAWLQVSGGAESPAQPSLDSWLVVPTSSRSPAATTSPMALAPPTPSHGVSVDAATSPVQANVGTTAVAPRHPAFPRAPAPPDPDYSDVVDLLDARPLRIAFAIDAPGHAAVELPMRSVDWAKSAYAMTIDGARAGALHRKGGSRPSSVFRHQKPAARWDSSGTSAVVKSEDDVGDVPGGSACAIHPLPPVGVRNGMSVEHESDALGAASRGGDFWSCGLVDAGGPDYRTSVGVLRAAVAPVEDDAPQRAWKCSFAAWLARAACVDDEPGLVDVGAPCHDPIEVPWTRHLDQLVMQRPEGVAGDFDQVDVVTMGLWEQVGAAVPVQEASLWCEENGSALANIAASPVAARCWSAVQAAGPVRLVRDSLLRLPLLARLSADEPAPDWLPLDAPTLRVFDPQSGRRLGVRPEATLLWEHVGLAPCAPKKCVRYSVVVPSGARFTDAASTLLRQLGAVYNACELGSLEATAPSADWTRYSPDSDESLRAAFDAVDQALAREHASIDASDTRTTLAAVFVMHPFAVGAQSLVRLSALALRLCARASAAARQVPAVQLLAVGDDAGLELHPARLRDVSFGLYRKIRRVAYSHGALLQEQPRTRLLYEPHISLVPVSALNVPAALAGAEEDALVDRTLHVYFTLGHDRATLLAVLSDATGEFLEHTVRQRGAREPRVSLGDLRAVVLWAAGLAELADIQGCRIVYCMVGPAATEHAMRAWDALFGSAEGLNPGAHVAECVLSSLHHRAVEPPCLWGAAPAALPGTIGVGALRVDAGECVEEFSFEPPLARAVVYSPPPPLPLSIVGLDWRDPRAGPGDSDRGGAPAATERSDLRWRLGATVELAVHRQQRAAAGGGAARGSAAAMRVAAYIAVQQHRLSYLDVMARTAERGSAMPAPAALLQRMAKLLVQLQGDSVAVHFLTVA